VKEFDPHYAMTLMPRLLSFDRLAYKARFGKAGNLTIHAQTAVVELTAEMAHVGRAVTS
jgi:hypothetical protein